MSDVALVTEFSAADSELILKLARNITGTNPTARRQLFLANVARRMRQAGAADLISYLQIVESSPGELAALVSALTIHTTSWFREMPHFERLESIVEERLPQLGGQPFRVLSAGCSTGEEAYSTALLLEAMKATRPGLDYRIDGWDIDPVSVAHAQRGIYAAEHLGSIPLKFRRYVLLGSGRSANLFTIDRVIRDRCTFARQSLTDIKVTAIAPYDLVVCRNVLIYFDRPIVAAIVQSLLEIMRPNGTLCLGHSETIATDSLGLERLGNAMYRRGTSRVSGGPVGAPSDTNAGVILMVETSPEATKSLRESLEGQGYSVVLTADTSQALSMLKRQRVDLLTLDTAVVGGRGPRWLREIRQIKPLLPVLVFSLASADGDDDLSIQYLQAAQDFLDRGLVGRTPEVVIAHIKALLTAHRRSGLGSAEVTKASSLSLSRPDLILLGASTGGIETLLQVLRDLPQPFPPVVVVQHIAPSFARAFAGRLAKASGLALGDPTGGTEIRPSHLYLGSEDCHIGVRHRAGLLYIEVSSGPSIHGVRPSVDHLFNSAAALPDRFCLAAALLTGMGRDGARGLCQLRSAGAMTFAQSEESCVVFGMPREAIMAGGAGFIGNPDDIRRHLINASRLAKPAIAS